MEAPRVDPARSRALRARAARAARHRGFTRVSTVIHLHGGGEEGSARTSPGTPSITTRAGGRPGAAARRSLDARVVLGRRSRSSTRTTAGPTRARRSTSRCARRGRARRGARARAAPGAFVVSLRPRRPADARRRARAGSSSTRACASSSTRRSDWNDELIAELAGTGAVDVGRLQGPTTRGRSSTRRPTRSSTGASPRRFPDAWIEDPALTDETDAVLAAAPRPHHLGRADPLGRRRRGAAVPAAVLNVEAVALRHAARAARLLRLLRRARDRALRRRPVRARPGPRPDPVPGVAVPPGRAERRRAARATTSPSRAPGLPTSPLEPAPAESGFRWDYPDA